MVEAKVRSVTGAAAAGKAAAVADCVGNASVADCIALLDVCSNEQTPIQDAKLLLSEMAKKRLNDFKNQEVEDVCKAAMEKLAPRK